MDPAISFAAFYVMTDQHTNDPLKIRILHLKSLVVRRSKYQEENFVEFKFCLFDAGEFAKFKFR